MRLAHYSDIHVTHVPLAEGFAVKRLAAMASWSLTGRGRHFSGSPARIAALLADVDAAGVDHAVCTGDLSGVAGERELAACAALYGERLRQPARHTVLPGNHDRYLPRSQEERFFEAHFGPLCEGAAFPFVKALPGGVTLVGLDTARPVGLLDSSGLVGPAQRARLLEVLTDKALAGRFVVVALHYGLLRADGKRDKPAHGLRDDVEVMALLDRPEVFVDLVVHGHMHRAYAVRTQRRLVACAGSATDLHVACGYNLYDIDAAAFRVRATRRAWSRSEGRYVEAPGSPLAFDVVTRA